jgi:hypothetical protein
MHHWDLVGPRALEKRDVYVERIDPRSIAALEEDSHGSGNHERSIQRRHQRH